VTPDPRDVVRAELDGSDLTVRVNMRAGTVLSEEQLLGLLQREPVTWGGLSEVGLAFVWDVSRSRIRQFRNVKAPEDCLLRLGALLEGNGESSAGSALCRLRLFLTLPTT
jgi:hypothetical protein